MSGRKADSLEFAFAAINAHSESSPLFNEEFDN
jgi:hypothetical protein